MATIYVSSVVGDNTTGATWATAKTSVTAALAIAGNGDTICVDSAHSVTAGASISWDVPTANYAVQIISVNRNGSTTTGDAGWLAGATEVVGAASAAVNIGGSRAGCFNIYGVTLRAGTNSNTACDINLGATTGGVARIRLQNCTLGVPSAGALAQHVWGKSSTFQSGNAVIEMVNCTIETKDSTSNPAVVIQGANVTLINCTHAYSGSNKSPSLFSWFGNQAVLRIMDSDLAGFNSTGGAYFDVSGYASGETFGTNVKLSGTPSIVTGTWPAGNAAAITLVNVDSGDTRNTFEYRTRAGTLTESESVYANAGARFDGSGVSWQVVTTSDCSEAEPFTCPWLFRWADETSSLTASVEVAQATAATPLTPRTTWLETDYVSSASFPVGTLASSRTATPFTGSPSDYATSSETWTGSVTVLQTLSNTFTPAERSLLRGRLVVGAASKTIYLDPVLRLTGHGANPAVRWTREGAFNAESSTGGPVRRVGGVIAR